MKAIILAAGYATRMYPLTENQPKPLLKVGDKFLIEYIIDKIDQISEIDEIVIVSNHKFIKHFEDFAKNYSSKNSISVIDNGSTTNENRLGAIKDLLFALEQKEIGEDVLVIAGDNLIEFSLKDFHKKFKNTGKHSIAVYDMEDIEAVRKKYGVVLLGKDDEVVHFEEKPENPKSSIKSICCYIFKSGIKDLLREYLVENNPDATGFFISWLIKKTEVHAHKFKGNVYDIGDLDNYKRVCKIFNQ